MAISDESYQARVALDGADTTIHSVTVPAGELWYVDAVYVSTDASGDDATVDVGVGVADTTTLDNNSGGAPNMAARGAASTGIDTTISTSATLSVGAYATENEEIRVIEVNESGTTGGYHVHVSIRRIL